MGPSLTHPLSPNAVRPSGTRDAPRSHGKGPYWAEREQVGTTLAWTPRDAARARLLRPACAYALRLWKWIGLCRAGRCALCEHPRSIVLPVVACAERS